MPIEGQNNKVQEFRQEVLESDMPERERRITLRAIDDLWAEYLAQISEFRSGVQWLSWGGRDPHRAYLLKIDEWFRAMEAGLDEEIARRLEVPGDEFARRGAVWTYLTTDESSNSFGLKLSRTFRDLIAVYGFSG